MTALDTTPPGAASRPAAAAHWLGVMCGGHRFLVPLAQSGEIAAPSPVQALPHAKPWVRGVTTLRGELYTVVDLLGWLGWPALADEAYRQMGEALPDLILLDVVMPGQNGFQLTRHLSRHPQYGKVPVFLCTSKNQETDRVWGLRQGARAFITKPVKEKELLACINDLLPSAA